MLTLRPYQQDCVEKIATKFWSGINRQVVKMPTGTGKTCVFAAIPEALKFSKRMLVLVHREELATQAADKLRKWNPTRTVGVEMGELRSNGEQLVVASVPTIGKAGSPRLLQFDPDGFDGIICDEAHHGIAKSYRTIFNHFNVYNNRKILCAGFTATVNRADGHGLNRVFQEITYDMSILDAIRQGWLSDLKGIRIKSTTGLDDVHTLAGDFNQGELGTAVNTQARNDLVVRSWLEHGKDRQTIVFAVDVDHAKALAAAFKGYGVAAEAIWGDDPARAEKLAYHKAGGLKVLVNCQILTEGYDDWRIGCVVLARPTKSEGLYTQIVGRGTRIPDELGAIGLIEARAQKKQIAKEDCILLDVVDVTKKHSLVSLPSLFGMNQEMNLRGESIVTVMDELTALKASKPFVDFTRVDDVRNLRTYAEEVDLFKVQFAPEIVQISDYQWHRTGSGSYVLLLTGGESVVVMRDILDNWHIVGKVNGTQIMDQRSSFEDAIREADYKVQLFAGRGLLSIVKRKAKWHDEPPSPAQLKACKWLGIKVPPGATKGEVHQKMTFVMGQKKRAQQGAIR